MACCTSVFAQTESQHTVQRGETLESIATKYGVTVDALKQANKDAQQYLYAGMKLVIPQKTSGLSKEKELVKEESATDKNQSSSAQEKSDLNIYKYNTERNNNVSSLESQSNKGGFVSHIGWGKMTDLGSEYNFNSEVVGEVGYRHYIQESFFAEGLLGFRSYTTELQHTIETKENDFIIPLHVGVDLGIVNIFTGPRLTFPSSVKATTKIQGDTYTIKNKKSTYSSFEIGADILSFIRVSYAFGLGGESSSYFNIGLCFCFDMFE